MLSDVECFEPGAVVRSRVVVVSCRFLPIWLSRCVIRALYLAICVRACVCVCDVSGDFVCYRPSARSGGSSPPPQSCCDEGVIPGVTWC